MACALAKETSWAVDIAGPNSTQSATIAALKLCVMHFMIAYPYVPPVVAEGDLLRIASSDGGKTQGKSINFKRNQLNHWATKASPSSRRLRALRAKGLEGAYITDK